MQFRRSGIPSDKTYGEALLKWIESGAPKSMLRHAKVTRTHIGDDAPLHSLVPIAHDMKQKMLSDGLQPTTINRRLSVVRRILNVAYKEWDWIKEPLGQKIKLLSEKGTARELYLSKKEVEQLVSNITNETIKKIVILAAYTGLRQGEIRNLTKDNWSKPYIILDSKTKGKKPRTIPLINELHYIMDSTDFNVTEWQIRKHFEAAREAIERPDIHFHDLRHTFASWLVNDPSIPLTLIRDILGHSSLAVTSKYAHLRGENLELISNALSGERGTTGGTANAATHTGESNDDQK